ncbi:MAG: glycosyltransferase family 2 protein [Bacteroidota bacterium]
MSAPTFSIIITTVDRPALLLDAVNSVLAQTCTDFELIVVNDGGPDLDPLLGQLDPRLVLLRLPGKSGPGRARNRGAAIASGRFIGFLDDDDLFHPEHLAILLAALESAPEAVVYSDAVVFHEVIENGVRRLVNRATPWQHVLFIRQRLWIHNFIPVQTFAVSLQSFLAVGGFDEDLRAFEDWDLLLKLAARHDFIHLPKTTSEIRMRPEAGGHRSASVKDDRSEAAIIEALYQRHGDLGDPLIREGRQRVRQSGFISGPDFLVVDSNAAGLAYQTWLARHPAKTTGSAEPATALLLLVTSAPDKASWLDATLASFAQLRGKHHRLVVFANTASAAEAAFPKSPDPRIRRQAVSSLDDHAGLCLAFNEAIVRHDGDWVAILPAGSTLDADLADRLATFSTAAAVYTDHDCIIHPQGIRCQPAFKPDFNPDLLAAEDYIGPALWLRREEILDRGGLQPFPGLGLQEILWRIAETAGADAIGHLAEPLLHLPAGEAPPPIQQAARQVVVEQHLARRQTGARVSAGPLADTLHIEYPLPTTPLVSIVVTAPAEPALLLRCLNNLREKTDYSTYEILLAVPAGSPLIAECLALAAFGGHTVRAPAIPAGSSLAAARNHAAAAARGSLLAFIAGSTEIVQPDWLASLVRHALRPEVGAVGARLLAPDGTVSGGGLILGAGGGAGPAFAGQTYRAPGYLNRLQLVHNLSAISGRCLLVGTALFRETGGFAAADFPDRHADTDFCLRLGEQGRLIVWNPQAVLADHAAADNPEATPALLRRWGHRLTDDPAYNHHLSLHCGNFLVDPERRDLSHAPQ